MADAEKPPRIFSGIQPTGGLHLGNYLGALRNFVELQATHECIYCVVDLHAITAPHDPSELRQNTYEAVAAFLAAGVDADAHIIFNQARVAAHSELAWIFNCVARYGWLDRMTQFKEKVGKHRAKASVGLWVYPNLMAADILAYKAQKVPVGDDQRQHLELVRDIAQKFNHDFCPQDAPFFPLPEPLILKSGGRVMSLRDGTKKMSKSEPSSMSRILLTDDADAIAQKIRKAKTDALPCPADEAELLQRPEAANLVGIFAALANKPQAAVLGEYGGKPFSAFKADLAALTIATITPIGAEMARLLGDVAHLEQIMSAGAARAEAIARPIMKKVNELVGFAV